MILKLWTGDKVLFSKVYWAGGFFQKMKGLLGKKKLTDDEAMMFPNAPSIHTFFMKFPIDIIYLNKEKEILRCFPKIRRNRIVPYIASKYTIEMPENSIEIKKIKTGMFLTWEESGQTTLEFALMIGIITLALVIVLASFKTSYSNYFRSIIDFLSDY